MKNELINMPKRWDKKGHPTVIWRIFFLISHDFNVIFVSFFLQKVYINIVADESVFLGFLFFCKFR